MERFQEETDCIEIIKSIRLLKTLSKVLLTSNQIQLLSLDNSHLVSTEILDKISDSKSKLNRVESFKSKFNSEDNDMLDEDRNVINHMPSYLNTGNHYKFRDKVDAIVQHMFRHEYQDEGNIISYLYLTLFYIENAKIIELAYGIKDEDNESTIERLSSRSPRIIEQSSSIGLT